MHIMVDKDEYALLLEEHRRMKNVVKELYKFRRKQKPFNFFVMGCHYDVEDVFKLRDLVSSDPYLKELFKQERAMVVAE